MATGRENAVKSGCLNAISSLSPTNSNHAAGSIVGGWSAERSSSPEGAMGAFWLRGPTTPPSLRVVEWFVVRWVRNL
jgi:hypothetical protein